MDYKSFDHQPNRLSRSKRLELPVRLLSKDQKKGMRVSIANGKVVDCRHKFGVRIRDEQSLAEQTVVYDREYIAGVYNVSDSSFMVTDSDRNAYLMDFEGKVLEVFPEACFMPPGESLSDGACLQMYKPFAGKKLLDPSCLSYSTHAGGSPLWQFELTNYGYALSGDKLLYQSSSGTLYLLDVASGEVLRKTTPHELGHLLPEWTELGATQGAPRIFDDIIITSLHGHLVGVSLSTGKLLWKRRIWSGGENPCVSEEGLVYFVWCEQIVHNRKAFELWHFGVFDARTGEEKKLFVLNPPDSETDKRVFQIKNSIARHVYGDVTSTHYWCTLYGGLLLAINLETGNIDWHYNFQNIFYSYPFIICNNRLYIQSQAWDCVFEGEGGYSPD